MDKFYVMVDNNHFSDFSMQIELSQFSEGFKFILVDTPNLS